jgi:ribosomal protein S27AE
MIKELSQTHERDLQCPRCGSLYLHHRKVVVYCRRREDSDAGITVAIDTGCEYVDEAETGKVNILPNAERGNPSNRRDGVRIALQCEECGDEHWMTVAQHKGNTILRWPK